MGTKDDFDKSCEFIHLLIDTFQSYGVSSKSMEVLLADVVDCLSVQGDFVVTPNFVQAVIWSDDREHQWVYLITSRTGDYDLAKLHKVMEVADGLLRGDLDASNGVEKLEEIISQPKEYSAGLTAFATFLACAGFGPLIGASIRDALLGGAISVAALALSIAAKRSSRTGALSELLVAFMAVVLARLIALLIPGADIVPIMTIAIIIFIPGFGLTIAPRELIFGNSLAGTMWMTNALVIVFKLFLGLAIGTFVMNYFLGHPPIVKTPEVSFLVRFIGATLFVAGFAIILRVQAAYLLAVVLAGWITWGVLQSANGINSWVGTFLGTVTITALSGWFARFFKVPSLTIALPSIMILLPGLAAMEAMKTFAVEGALSGFRATYPVLVLIVSLIGGSLIGDALGPNAMVKTTKALRSMVGMGHHKNKPKGERRS